MREVNSTHEVHFDGALPLVNGSSEKALRGRAPGIGHADIGAAEFLNHGIDKIADGARVGDIERLGQYFRLVLAANLFRDGVERFPVTRADRQTATLGSKGLGSGSPNPPPRGGDIAGAGCKSRF